MEASVDKVLVCVRLSVTAVSLWQESAVGGAVVRSAPSAGGIMNEPSAGPHCTGEKPGDNLPNAFRG